MSNRDNLNPDIDDVCRRIFEPHNHISGRNGESRRHLPSRKDVKDIICCMESLIFPGYQYGENPRIEDERERVHRLFLLMTGEIEHNLNYNHSPEKLEDAELREKARDTAPGLALEILERLPEVRALLLGDVEALLRGDPAARNRDEIILSYPGLEAITVYRLAHEFYVRELYLISRMMSEQVHRSTGIEIHPGAKIGKEFFIDHGTGVVIGETAVIGSRVKLYQGVTIGALSVDKKLANRKRHPTIEDDVTIYAGATILGGNTVVGKGAIVGGNVWITSSVPGFSMIYNRPADYRIINRYNEGSTSVNENWSI